jgi:hypothetical protein
MENGIGPNDQKANEELAGRFRVMENGIGLNG